MYSYQMKVWGVLMLAISLLSFSTGAVAESRTSVNSSVSSNVSTSTNNGVDAGDDVEINGPITRGRNRVDTDIDTGTGNNRVVVGNGAVDVGNGQVRVGNGVHIDNGENYYQENRVTNNGVETRHIVSKKKGKKPKKHVISSKNAGTGVTKEIYHDGDCLIEHKQVGSISKDDVRCP
jgi:hypothetical protein